MFSKTEQLYSHILLYPWGTQEVFLVVYMKIDNLNVLKYIYPKYWDIILILCLLGNCLCLFVLC